MSNDMLVIWEVGILFAASEGIEKILTEYNKEAVSASGGYHALCSYIDMIQTRMNGLDAHVQSTYPKNVSTINKLVATAYANCSDYEGLYDLCVSTGFTLGKLVHEIQKFVEEVKDSVESQNTIRKPRKVDPHTPDPRTWPTLEQNISVLYGLPDINVRPSWKRYSDE